MSFAAADWLIILPEFRIILATKIFASAATSAADLRYRGQKVYRYVFINSAFL